MDTKSDKSGKPVSSEKRKKKQPLPVCDYAPEWAEHARFYREDEPCDNGHDGLPPCADDEDGCPVTSSKLSADVGKLG